MASNIHKFYPSRQVINMGLVEASEYDERIILCIPLFAWRVARAYLSRQAQWDSTYAVSYGEGYYVSPDEETMDTIKRSLADALAEEDMSCDIVSALEDLTIAITNQMDEDTDDVVSAIDALTAKECGPGCGGSGGAGTTEGEASDFEDDGSNYPDDFDDRADYLGWKCGVANLIVNQLHNDLEWLQTTEITQITATALAATLLTPVPLDDAAVLVGTLLAWAIEGYLDTRLQAIIDDLDSHKTELVCDLYYAISANGAVVAMEDFALNYLTTIESYLFMFFVNNDTVNRLFEENNLILGDDTCAGCVGLCETSSIAVGTGTITATDVTIDSQNAPSYRNWAVAVFDTEGGGWKADICGDGVTVSNMATSIGVNSVRLYDNSGTLVYDATTVPTIPYDNITEVSVLTGDYSSPPAFQLTFDYER